MFVPLPYGTGNDLSRALGWGRKEGRWAENLESLTSALINAPRENFTVWDVTIHASYVEGYSRNGPVVISKNGDASGVQTFTKCLTNYVNLGLDSVISNAFEERRTGSRAVNNMIYTWLTVRHLFFSCCDPVNIKDIIESFTE